MATPVLLNGSRTLCICLLIIARGLSERDLPRNVDNKNPVEEASGDEWNDPYEEEEKPFASVLAAKFHSHVPHLHSPHGHNPHIHSPHSHVPHSHFPHLHTPLPTRFPTSQPTRFPTTRRPTKFPTPQPTRFPTPLPTGNPTHSPTTQGPTTPTITRNPSTVSPSSLSPSTVSPVTESPSTLSPTTESPTSTSPSTSSPLTDSPTSFSPTSVSPSSQSPTTPSPSTTAPTDAPTTLAPVVPTISPTLPKRIIIVTDPAIVGTPNTNPGIGAIYSVVAELGVVNNMTDFTTGMLTIDLLTMTDVLAVPSQIGISSFESLLSDSDLSNLQRWSVDAGGVLLVFEDSEYRALSLTNRLLVSLTGVLPVDESPSPSTTNRSELAFEAEGAPFALPLRADVYPLQLISVPTPPTALPVYTTCSSTNMDDVIAVAVNLLTASDGARDPTAYPTSADTISNKGSGTRRGGGFSQWFSSRVGATVLFDGSQNTNEYFNLNVNIEEGQYIGVIGYRGVTVENSYGQASSALTGLCGFPITLTRFVSQQSAAPYTEFSNVPSLDLVGRIALNASFEANVTMSPSAFSPGGLPTHSPSPAALIPRLSADTTYFLGGDSTSAANIPLVNEFTNRFVGVALSPRINNVFAIALKGGPSSIVTCFQTDLADKSMVFPWLARNLSAETFFRGSSGLEIILENVTLDFDPSEGLSPCGPFQVETLRLANVRIIGVYEGFRLIGGSTNLYMSSVQISHPPQSFGHRTRYLIFVNGTSSSVVIERCFCIFEAITITTTPSPSVIIKTITTVYRSVIEDYIILENGIEVTGDSATVNISDTKFDNLTGSGLDDLGGQQQWSFHAFSLIYVHSQTKEFEPTTVSLKDNNYTDINGFHYSMMLSYETETATSIGTEVSSDIIIDVKDVRVRSSSIGDSTWRSRLIATSSPTSIPTVSPTASPTNNPTRTSSPTFSSSLADKTEMPSMSPFSGTASPTQSPTAVVFPTGLFAGLISISGNVGTVSVDGLTYEDDSDLKDPSVKRACIITQQTTLSSVRMRNILLSNARVEAVIFDTSNTVGPSLTNGNDHSINGLDIFNLDRAIQTDATTDVRSTVMLFVGSMNSILSPLTLAGIRILNSDVSLINATSDITSQAAFQGLILNGQIDVQIRDVSIRHPNELLGGLLLQRPLITISMPNATSNVQATISFENFILDNYRIDVAALTPSNSLLYNGNALVSVSCLLQASFNVRNASFSNIVALDNPNAPSQIDPTTAASLIFSDSCNVEYQVIAEGVSMVNTTRVHLLNSFALITASSFTVIDVISALSAPVFKLDSGQIDSMFIASSSFSRSFSPVLSASTTNSLSAQSIPASRSIEIRSSLFANNVGSLFGVVYMQRAQSTQEFFTSNLLVSDSELYGNSASQGAALYIEEGTVNLVGTRFANNHVTGDGGAVVSGGMLFTSNSNFESNSAGGSGGDIMAAYLRATNTFFTNSSSIMLGGSIYLTFTQFLASLSNGLSNAQMTATGSVFSGCTSGLGSFIYVESSGYLNVENCAFTGSEVQDGSIFMDSLSTLIVRNSTFDSLTATDAGLVHFGINAIGQFFNISVSDTLAAQFGGAIFCDTGSTVLVVDSLFTGITSVANGGVFYLGGTDSTVTVSNSKFTSISALSGGVAWILGGNMELRNCNITAVKAGSNGGVITLLGSAMVTISDSTLINTEADTSGLAELSNDAFLNITASHISGIRATQAGIIRLENAARMEIYQSTIEECFASTVGLIQIRDGATCLLSSVYAISNSAESEASVVSVSGTGRFTADKCTFSDNSMNPNTALMPAGVLRASENSELVVRNCSFIRNSGRIGGAISALDSASLEVSNCVFQNNSALLSAGAIYAYSTASLSISSSNFSFNSAGTAGGSIQLVGERTKAYLEQCTIDHSRASSGALRAEKGAVLIVRNALLEFNEAYNAGGAISIVNGTLNITLSIIRFNRAGYVGGAVSLEAAQSFYVFATNFEFNELYPGALLLANELKGGALFIANTLQDAVLQIEQGVMFLRNNASLGAGGAVYFDNELSRPSIAGEEGGAQPQAITTSGAVQFLNNTASQGAELASAPFIVTWNATDTMIADSGIVWEAAIFVTITDIFGTPVVDQRTEVQLVAFGQNQSTSLAPTEFTFQNGNQLLSDGVACFGSRCSPQVPTAVVAPPDTALRMYANVKTIIPVDGGGFTNIELNTTQVDLIVRACTSGQVINAVSCGDCPSGRFQPISPILNTTCTECPAGRFASSVGSSECLSCNASEIGGFTAQEGASTCVNCDENFYPNPEFTSCLQCPPDSVGTSDRRSCECNIGFFAYESDVSFGIPTVCDGCPSGGACTRQGSLAGEIQPMRGYWLSIWSPANELTFLKCRNDACIGERDECASGYNGILCTVCDAGWSRARQHECIECQGDPGLAAFQIIGSWILVAIVGIALTYINVNEAEEEIAGVKDQRQESVDEDHFDRISTLVKITISAIQFNSLAADFDYEWPNFARSLFLSQRTVGIFGSLLNVDCAQGSNRSVRPIYVNTVVIAMIPVIIPVLSLVILAIFEVKYRKAVKAQVMASQAMLERKHGNNDALDESDDDDDGRSGVGERKLHDMKMRRLVKKKGEAQEHGDDNKDDNMSKSSKSRKILIARKETEYELDVEDEAQNAEDCAATDTKSHYTGATDKVVTFDTVEQVVSDPREKALRRRQVHAQFNASNVSLMFMLYPSLIIQTFTLFNCEQLASDPDSLVLVEDMSQRCYVEPHLLYLLFLGFPMMFIYVLGFPAVCLFFLNRFKDDMPWNLDDRESKMKIETVFRKKRNRMSLYLLYHGYKPAYFQWEIVIMFRKVLIACFAVFVNTEAAQANLAVLLIFVSFVAQLRLSPFEQDTCNNLELAALATSFMTYFLGGFLHFSSQNVRILVSVLVVIVNCLFLTVAMYMISTDIVGAVRSARTKMQRKRREAEGSRRVAIENMRRRRQEKWESTVGMLNKRRRQPHSTRTAVSELSTWYRRGNQGLDRDNKQAATGTHRRDLSEMTVLAERPRSSLGIPRVYSENCRFTGPSIVSEGPSTATSNAPIIENPSNAAGTPSNRNPRKASAATSGGLESVRFVE
eukprot:jgi/Bigna1/75341/fgenesh1_pg.34_\